MYCTPFKSTAKTAFFLVIFRGGLRPIGRSSAASMSLGAGFLGGERFIAGTGWVGPAADGPNGSVGVTTKFDGVSEITVSDA
jgi:hypothetical protein